MSPELTSDGPLARRPIGVFDSGVGGLTVLRALRAALPEETFLYLGDTARLPYGTKSEHTVVRYALQAADELVGRDIKCLVIACNTASAAALPALQERHAELPVIGVIEPGARAACAGSPSGRIAVLGTESTVQGGAYTRAILRIRPDAQVLGVACSLFVALAEEGWTDGAVASAAATRYLAPLRASGPAAADMLVLACTHFPVLEPVIRAAVGPGLHLVDSAATTAATVRLELERRGLLRPPALEPGPQGRASFLATDGAARFARVGSRFLGEPILAEEVELIDL
ncbi:MAG TPA: glutamate racemase [Steroidobacteraceae bacterium]|nr:glutamate racemase [Steroidobacteraceae bacterium]